MLTQGKDDNKAQDKKDKLEMTTVCVRGNNFYSIKKIPAKVFFLLYTNY